MSLKKHGSEWSYEEIKIITELYSSVGPTRLTDIICRSWRAIEGQAGRLGLRRYTPRWTHAETAAVKKLEKIQTRTDLAQNMKRFYIGAPRQKRGRKRKMLAGAKKEYNRLYNIYRRTGDKTQLNLFLKAQEKLLK